MRRGYVTFWENITMQIPNFSNSQGVVRPGCQGRFSYIGAAVGMAIAVLLIAPGLVMGASPAYAETGVNGYASCLGGDAKPPPPGVSAEDWFPSVHIITSDFDSGVPAAEITRRLVDMGVAPNDAATRVRCFLANQPRGQGR